MKRQTRMMQPREFHVSALLPHRVVELKQSPLKRARLYMNSHKSAAELVGRAAALFGLYGLSTSLSARVPSRRVAASGHEPSKAGGGERAEQPRQGVKEQRV